MSINGQSLSVSSQLTQYSDEYWTTLTPEKSFLVRVFVDRCMTIKVLSLISDWTNIDTSAGHGPH